MNNHFMSANLGDVCNFCAVDVLCNFKYSIAQRPVDYNNFQARGETIKGVALQLVKAALADTQQYLLIGDVHGKSHGMHFYVTPYLPKRIVTKKGTWKVTKRRPFYNANSGNMVQEVAITLMGRRTKSNNRDE